MATFAQSLYAGIDKIADSIGAGPITRDAAKIATAVIAAPFFFTSGLGMAGIGNFVLKVVGSDLATGIGAILVVSGIATMAYAGEVMIEGVKRSGIFPALKNDLVPAIRESWQDFKNWITHKPRAALQTAAPADYIAPVEGASKAPAADGKNSFNQAHDNVAKPGIKNDGQTPPANNGVASNSP